MLMQEAIGSLVLEVSEKRMLIFFTSSRYTPIGPFPNNFAKTFLSTSGLVMLDTGLSPSPFVIYGEIEEYYTDREAAYGLKQEVDYTPVKIDVASGQDEILNKYGKYIGEFSRV